MVVSFFRNNKPFTAILMALFGFALWFPVLKSPVISKISGSMPVFEGIQNLVSGNPLYWNVLGLLVLLLQAFLLYFIFEKHDILTGRTYLPAVTYVALMSCSPALTTFHPPLLANLFLIWSLDSLIALYRNEDAFMSVFNIGLLFGLATLSYFPAIALSPVIWIGLLVFHPFNLREWLIALMGLLTPVFFAFTYYFWFDQVENFWIYKIVYPVIQAPNPGQLHQETYYLIAALFLLIVLSSVKVLENLGNTSMKTSKSMSFLFWIIIFGFISVFISPSWTIRDFTFMAIPLAVFIGNYLNLARAKWLAELLFAFLLFAMFLVRVS